MPIQEDHTITADTFLTGIWKENPVFVMLLGMCPVLAVTNSVINALAMGIATTFVLLCSSAIISILRKLIPKEVRIATYIVIIATFVTITDYVIQAISLELYNALGAFIQLIVVNCMILGRAEAYASKNHILKTITNGLGMGTGFTIALLCLGSVRELLGNGSLLGYSIFGSQFQPWVVMILPPGGFFVLGGWLLLFNWLKEPSANNKKPSAIDKEPSANYKKPSANDKKTSVSKANRESVVNGLTEKGAL
jgi:electron transport complex protein RnfE